MDFYNHTRAFHPLDLEIMDRVYEAAWAAVKRATRFGISTRMASARSHYASWCSTTRARAGLISTSSATGASQYARELDYVHSSASQRTRPVKQKDALAGGVLRGLANGARRSERDSSRRL